MKQPSVNQMRKFFSNLNASGAMVRANTMHAAIRLAQSGGNPVPLLIDAGFPFEKSTDKRSRSKLSPATLAKHGINPCTCNKPKTQCKCKAVTRCAIFGQADWRMESRGSVGKVVDGNFARISIPATMKRTQFDSEVTITNGRQTRIETVAGYTAKPVNVGCGKLDGKRVIGTSKIRNVDSLLTRADALIASARVCADSRKRKTTLTRASRILRYATVLHPMHVDARMRWDALQVAIAATGASMQRAGQAPLGAGYPLPRI